MWVSRETAVQTLAGATQTEPCWCDQVSGATWRFFITEHYALSHNPENKIVMRPTEEHMPRLYLRQPRKLDFILKQISDCTQVNTEIPFSILMWMKHHSCSHSKTTKNDLLPWNTSWCYYSATTLLLPYHFASNKFFLLRSPVALHSDSARFRLL